MNSRNRAIAGGRLRSTGLAVVLAGMLAVLAGCTPLYRNHGYVPTDTELAALTVGVDTRDTVTATIGVPTAGGVLDASGFYYVASRFRHLGPLAPQEIEREILAISFNATGVMTNIERFGLEDGRVVTLSRRVTDDNVRDTTFLRQLLGNLGNFDPTTIFGSE